MIKKSRISEVVAALEEQADMLKDDGQFSESESLDDAVLLIAQLCALIDEVKPGFIVDDSGELVKETGSMESLRLLALEMRNLNEKKLVLKAQMSDINMPLEALRKQRIPDLMESLGLRTATFQGLGRVQMASDMYASTRKGQKPFAIQWLQDCGYGEMVKPTYNASSLKALFRRLLTEGGEIPADIFNVTPFTRASIVKA